MVAIVQMPPLEPPRTYHFKSKIEGDGHRDHGSDCAFIGRVSLRGGYCSLDGAQVYQLALRTHAVLQRLKVVRARAAHPPALEAASPA